ncbi:aminoacyl-tRNA hydrolase [Candidatus Chlamydia sanziniae]|uniref:Peptidyl-tRNA hydrolase n=1 Tax=Candidatus Chlamydia sanziniae TaxID=1806891 RepID=A0A1A9HXB3_9CHLA|nr:aminoacyl-tRNA hydrolase [Candidatus Chlamydia sanziniae]ANH78743.1 Peptidyl-tRNA hydrolase [Candidatus Chlamydia sanziniae]
MARLIVAIGNPGAQYKVTRHNIGFLLADKLVQELDGSAFKSLLGCDSSLAKVESISGTLLFIKPHTFVNLSGKAVVKVKKYFHIALEHILVLADDVNHPFGKLRLRFRAGSGGHKGIKSITEMLGSNDYWQLRLGIGKPSETITGLSDFVLGEFSEKEQIQLDSIFTEAKTLFAQWCAEPRVA